MELHLLPRDRQKRYLVRRKTVRSKGLGLRTQNHACQAYLTILVCRDPQKHSCRASFNFECLQVVENRSGGQTKHLPKQIYAPNAFLAILVCRHTQNFAQNSLLEALVRRDPHKHSCHASFDFEDLQVAGARSGGQIKHLPKQIHAPDDFAVILVCYHTQNYAHNSFLEALVHRDPHKYSYRASFVFEGLQVGAKQQLEEEGTLLLPHLNG